METAIWQSFNQEDVILIGISNTNSQSIISDFVEENGLTFPILYDSGSSGGVQGGDTYDLYYMPNDGSPYPRDFVVDQEGIIVYANNEIDTEWMLYEINNLIDFTNGLLGDINQDLIINVLDIISLINFVLESDAPTSDEFVLSDLNQDNIINVLDIVSLVNLILN